MRTIAQFAVEMGVSVQTVYRQLNKVKQETGECLTEKISGVARITEDGEEILKARLTNVKQELNAVKQAENEEIIFLREQNKALTDKISDLATQLAELTRNSQLLLGAEQSRTNPVLLMGGDETERYGFGERVKILFTGKSDKRKTDKITGDGLEK